jgi:hypothetical protein
MSETHVIRCYEYVTCPYEDVRDALRADPLGFFQRATTEATTRARGLVTTLRVKVGSLDVGADAVVVVRSVVEEPSAPGIHAPRTRLAIEWSAAQAAALFPSMTAELSIYPLSKDETQIDFSGRYAPPLGLFGEAVDALVGHRVAEASVHRFVEDLAARLREELKKPRKVSATA